MKKRIAVITICVILIGVFSALLLFKGEKPFKGLEATDIESAQVEILPPDKTVQITNIAELVPYLNDLVIYGKAQSFTDLAGQAIIVTLKMIDGEQIEIINSGNVFIVINGVGYRSKYEPDEALRSYANGLLR